jgi:hypothetical protein
VIIISHRGNIIGPVSDKENRPSYIDCAIGNGYHVEIDVRSINGELWLGHDESQYKIDHNWLDKRRNYLWIHCKNLEAAKECWAYHSFCHSDDPFTYTSTGKIWLHNDNFESLVFDNNDIIPRISKTDLEFFKKGNFYGTPFAVCTDYPAMLGN